MKKMILLALLTLPFSVNAMDVSPYKMGQKLTVEQAQEIVDRKKARPVQPWVEPGDINKAENAEQLKYAVAILSDTVNTIGPKVADPKMRYSGNSLNCTSCHLKGPSGLPGTAPYALPFVNVMNDYPNFRAREMTVGDAADRINGCMNRSQGVHGKPFAKDAKEMKAMIAYFEWLAEGTKPGQAMEGTGIPKIKFPNRKADVVAGKDLYNHYCISCHQAEGKGIKSPTYDKDGTYLFPPLAGDDSFNDGAGMSRLKKATRFIYGNMPLGVTHQSPALTVDQAYDIAAYMESLPRPNKKGRVHDFPVKQFRPIDYPVPGYFNGDKEALEKAKYGPFN